MGREVSFHLIGNDDFHAYRQRKKIRACAVVRTLDFRAVLWQLITSDTLYLNASAHAATLPQ